MSEDLIRTTALKYALQNAIQFDGHAHPKAVIGKVIGICKKEGLRPQEVIPIVNTVITQVNAMDVATQIEMLTDIAPEMLQKEKKERDFSLPPLPHAQEGEVVTRFPPEPNGYLHIGHAKAAIIDSEYAKIYKGKFILRFDDTNAEKEEEIFYQKQKEDLAWLGIEWDEEYCTSSHIPRHYELADKLIREGNAYVCTCSGEEIKNGRYVGNPCACRERTSEENQELWKDMVDGDSVNILRLRGNMTSDNTAMRDPTLFRIIEKEHQRTGTKYRCWPTYDFTGAVEDSIGGVTHPFRTKEYELRDEVYYYLLDLLELRKPHLMEFARLNIAGMPVSKRKIKPFIDSGQAEGFHDIRLPTLRGLERRGITPEGIRQFIFSQGISKVESTVDFSIVEAFNRKAIDPLAKRYYFVPDPVLLEVKDAPETIATLNTHPSNKDMGNRKISTKGRFYVRREDISDIPDGSVFRLKELYNVKIKSRNADGVIGTYAGGELLPNTMKLQWVTEDHIPLDLIVPSTILTPEGRYNPDSLKILKGYAEKTVSELQDGEILQFERVGFARIERKDGRLMAIFAHK